MKKLSALFAAFACTFVLSAAAWAHEGHAHKVMGTVTSKGANQFEMKTPEGKVVTVRLNQKTTFARAKQKVDAAALQVGERVVVEVASEKEMVASSVAMAAAAPAVAKK
jgi:hypothetical protein